MIEVSTDLPYGYSHGLQRLAGEHAQLSIEDSAAHAALLAEYRALEEEYSGHDEYPEDVDAKLGALEAAMEAFEQRPLIFDPVEMARAGVFITLDRDGSLAVYRGYVRPEDEAREETVANGVDELRAEGQGDGASFEATAQHAKGSAREIRAYAPKDQALHSIADRLQAAQRQNFYQLSANVTHRGRYYHEYCMTIDVSRDSPTGQPPTEVSEEAVVEALRDLARWLYRQLEAEYDHLTSDEAIEEGIIVNEYALTESGRRFG